MYTYFTRTSYSLILRFQIFQIFLNFQIQRYINGTRYNLLKLLSSSFIISEEYLLRVILLTVLFHEFLSSYLSN